MQIVSNEFLQAMGSSPYVARITLDGTDVIEGEAIQEIYFRGGANSSEDTILLGSTFAGSVEITLDQTEVNCTIEGRELAVELGIRLTENTQWISMGVYTAESPTSADGVLTVKAIDALGAKFDVIYEPLAGFDFSSAKGVSSTAYLTALCARRGVEVDLTGLEAIPLKASPDGFTERQIIGFISALYGGFANVDRLGVLRIRCYAEVDAQVSPDTYYEDGLEKATYSFTPGWLKCYNEAADLTMFVGNFDAQQGINLESIWMNQAILNSLWEKLEGFTYRPVPELSFLGNPLIDPGDVLTLEDAAGEKVKVPAMTITHEYDGGIITSISAYGQAKTTDYQSPTRRAVVRSAESAKQYAANENAKLDQVELLKRLTKEWVDDGIYLTEEGKIGVRASAIITGLLSSADQKTFYLDLDSGILRMNATEFSVAGKAVDTIAQEKINGMSQAEVFNKLTNNGSLPGLFMQGGQLCVNASYIRGGTVSADYIDVANLKVSAAQITSGTIDSARIPNLSADKITSGTLDSARINGATLNITKGATIAGWNMDENSIFSNSGTWYSGTFMCTGSSGSYSIGGSGSLNNWVFGAGGKFGVRKNGNVWCSDIHATGGSIGGWTIEGSRLSGTQGGYTIAISPIGVSGYYTKANGSKTAVTVTWDAILTAAMRWNE